MQPENPESASHSNPPKEEFTNETGTELQLTAEQSSLVEGWEQSHGRRMTEQEIRFGIELWNSTVGEL